MGHPLGFRSPLDGKCQHITQMQTNADWSHMLQHSCCVPGSGLELVCLLLQIAHACQQGQRLPIPPPAALPGMDTASFAGEGTLLPSWPRGKCHALHTWPGDGECGELRPPWLAGMVGYLQLLNQCWAQAPSDRPTFEAIVHQLRALL